jgi:hypothetical protein
MKYVQVIFSPVVILLTCTVIFNVANTEQTWKMEKLKVYQLSPTPSLQIEKPLVKQFSSVS